MKTNWRDELPWQILLLLMVFLMLWPIIFMLSTSLKDLNQVFESTLNPLPLPPTLANYRLVLEDFPIFTYIWNTFSSRPLSPSVKSLPVSWQRLPLCTTGLKVRNLFLTACC